MLKELLEIRKIIGTKDFIIILFLSLVEFILNLPYLIIKLISYPFWIVYDKYFDCVNYWICFSKIPALKEYIDKICKKMEREQRYYEMEVKR
mgnify:CR=1 FL=1